MAGQPWLAIKAGCLCLQDGLFQNHEGKKKKEENKGAVLVQGNRCPGSKKGKWKLIF